jgi:hypothetical protein
VVSEVMRDVMCGGAYRGVRKAGVEGQWELARVERRHGRGVMSAGGSDNRGGTR